MPERLTYSKARANLSEVLNRVSENKEVYYIDRRKGESVALISESELSSLLETAYLLRSPENAQRLLKSINDAVKGKGEKMAADKLANKLGLDLEK